MSADRILDRLTRLYPKAIDLSLDRIRALLADLGDPQSRLPPVIHVAGTNGKGSTVAYCRAILEAAGYRVHVYTSPHLVRFNERIRLAGELIAEAPLEAILAEVERVNASRPITFFEATTAAAFLAFARAPADAVVLETGMGGRLDATNLVARPAVCALTPISYDHMQHLGATLTAIAGEKAGILKPGVTAVIAPQTDEAGAVLAARAATAGAPLYRHGVEWAVAPTTAGLRYEGRRWRLDLPAPALPGRHQIDNAGTAIAAIERLDGFAISPDHLAAGLRGAQWPARLQRLTRGPLVDRLPPDWELWLDGGHNTSAAEALALWAGALADDKPLDLVVGMLTTKDPAAFLAPLRPHARRLRGVRIEDEPLSWPAQAIVDGATVAGHLEAWPADSMAAAIAELTAEPTPPARILICGSLHLAGTVLAANG